MFKHVIEIESSIEEIKDEIPPSDTVMCLYEYRIVQVRTRRLSA